MTIVICMTPVDEAIRKAGQILSENLTTTKVYYFAGSKFPHMIDENETVYIVGHGSAVDGMGAGKDFYSNPRKFLNAIGWTENGLNHAGKIVLVACAVAGVSIQPGQGFSHSNFAKNLSDTLKDKEIVAPVGLVDANTLKVYTEGGYFGAVYPNGWAKYINGRELGEGDPGFTTQ